MIHRSRLFLVVVWVTLAYTKPQALAFVTIVMAVGLSLRAVTKGYAKRRPKPSLLRRAIMEQLPGVPYAHSEPALAFSAGVKGYTASPTTNESFAPVTLEE